MTLSMSRLIHKKWWPLEDIEAREHFEKLVQPILYVCIPVCHKAMHRQSMLEFFER